VVDLFEIGLFDHVCQGLMHHIVHVAEELFANRLAQLNTAPALTSRQRFPLRGDEDLARQGFRLAGAPT
jgi:hypothetical protein